MAGFGGYDAALRMRDTIKKLATQIVEELRPADKVGRVVDLDRPGGFAFVVFSGAEDSPIKVKMLPGVQPQKYDLLHGTGNGAIVRVSGLIGSRFISEIMSEAPQMMAPRMSSPAITGGAGDDETVCSTFVFDMSGVVLPADDGTTPWWTAILNYPLKTVFVEIYTQAVMSDGSTWMMVENHIADSAYALGAQPTNLVMQSSTGVDTRTHVTQYDGVVDHEPAGTLGVTYRLERASTSTRAISSLRIMLRVYGTDVKLVKITDGVDSSV